MKTGRQANIHGTPLVFDPVAVGATSYRRETSKGRQCRGSKLIVRAAEDMATYRHQGKCCRNRFIGRIIGSEWKYWLPSNQVASRGVDSTGSGFSDPAEVVAKLARKRSK